MPTGDLLCPRWCVTYKKGKSNGRHGCFGRMWWDEIQPTVLGRAEPHNLRLVHPAQSRVVTIRENARAQVHLLNILMPWQFSLSAALADVYDIPSADTSTPVPAMKLMSWRLFTSGFRSARCQHSGDSTLTEARARSCSLIVMKGLPGFQNPRSRLRRCMAARRASRTTLCSWA